MVQPRNVRLVTEEALDDANKIGAYPESAVTQTTIDALPMQWVYRTLNDPYTDAYTDQYEGAWGGSGTRAGKLPVLDRDGVLSPSQVPSDFPTVARVRQMIASESPSTPDASSGRLVVQKEFPIFGARVGAARANRAPVAVIIAGSSTPAANPGFVADLATQLQRTFDDVSPSAVAWSTTADFTARTSPGLHVYNAARGGMKSDDYLDAGKRAKIAALTPALIHHMAGANDFRDQVPVATYKQNVLDVLESFDGLLTAPCQHVLWHPFERYAADKTIPWASYGAALKEIADSRDDTVCIDISGEYLTNGVPGADPIGLIGPDLTHQTAAGYAFMADLMTSIYLS